MSIDFHRRIFNCLKMAGGDPMQNDFLPRLVRPWVCMFCFLLAGKVSAQETRDAVALPDKAQTAQAIADFQMALGTGSFELSTSNTSASDQFEFRFAIYFKQDQGLAPFTVLVVRNKDRVACITRFLDTQPFLYMTNNYFLELLNLPLSNEPMFGDNSCV
jgi:hypothetical protein